MYTNLLFAYSVCVCVYERERAKAKEKRGDMNIFLAMLFSHVHLFDSGVTQACPVSACLCIVSFLEHWSSWISTMHNAC